MMSHPIIARELWLFTKRINDLSWGILSLKGCWCLKVSLELDPLKVGDQKIVEVQGYWSVSGCCHFYLGGNHACHVYDHDIHERWVLDSDLHTKRPRDFSSPTRPAASPSGVFFHSSPASPELPCLVSWNRCSQRSLVASGHSPKLDFHSTLHQGRKHHREQGQCCEVLSQLSRLKHHRF